MSGERQVFEYAVLRVIPRVDRGEAMNAGIVLYCRPLWYLGARVALDTDLLLALDPVVDVAGVSRGLAAVAEVCAAGHEAEGHEAAGHEAGRSASARAEGTSQVGAQDIGRRFRWLTAPRSTVIQSGPVHTGLTDDPDAEIERLLRVLVLRPR
jgi:hypothetical protein